ncbi:MAG TPA: hypothetical protein VGL18_13680 [Actinomycetota bacterium]
MKVRAGPRLRATLPSASRMALFVGSAFGRLASVQMLPSAVAPPLPSQLL